jgi:uncharacterized membrane protein YphA (DoxX/SURF4 family)
MHKTGLTALEIKSFLLGTLRSRWLYFFLRLALAVIFIYAGSMKLVDPKAFARTISHYDLVPEFLLPVVAIGLPLVEVLAGIALIFDLRPGLYGISAMMVLFVAILGYAVYSEMDVDCGCFGPEDIASRESLARAFYRDLALLGVVAFLHWSRVVRDRRNFNVSTQNLQ